MFVLNFCYRRHLEYSDHEAAGRLTCIKFCAWDSYCFSGHATLLTTNGLSLVGPAQYQGSCKSHFSCAGYRYQPTLIHLCNGTSRVQSIGDVARTLYTPFQAIQRRWFRGTMTTLASSVSAVFLASLETLAGADQASSEMGSGGLLHQCCASFAPPPMHHPTTEARSP